MKQANQIAKYLTDISGVNVFENSRKRKNVEVRSLLTFMLRSHLNMKYGEIRDFYILNGKHYDHSTAIYSYKSFEMYRRYSNSLETILQKLQITLLEDMTLGDVSNTHRTLLQHKIQYLNNKDINKVLNLVNEMPLKEMYGEEQAKEKAPANI